MSFFEFFSFSLALFFQGFFFFFLGGWDPHLSERKERKNILKKRKERKDPN
jgi:hypothetical protein